MRCSDVVLFPTLLGEAGPLVVAQAMASAKPVIASNRGAVPEMLGRDGRAGLLVPAGRSSRSPGRSNGSSAIQPSGRRWVIGAVPWRYERCQSDG